jgi:hypothetical protein
MCDENHARHGSDLMAQTSTSTVVKNIVLVHGGFVDGSGWEGVYKALKTATRSRSSSMADDVAVTKRAIAAHNGPVIRVLPVRMRDGEAAGL